MRTVFSINITEDHKINKTAHTEPYHKEFYRLVDLEEELDGEGFARTDRAHEWVREDEDVIKYAIIRVKTVEERLYENSSERQF